jgi:prevent-host-death family protein
MGWGGYMRKVGSREFKNRMGKYMRAVREGHTLLLTERGKTVARVVPEEHTETNSTDLDQRLKELEEQGLIRLARKPFPKFKPIKIKGKPASQIILEDRR